MFKIAVPVRLILGHVAVLHHQGRAAVEVAGSTPADLLLERVPSRAGVALVLAGLVAEGSTVVSGAHHIDRGYEDLVGALSSLGAPVTRP